MLELSTAREAGDTSVPAELVNYPARSAAGKKQRSQPPDLAGVMTSYRAAWVCPIDQPPIADGVVAIEGGRIAAVGIREPRLAGIRRPRSRARRAAARAGQRAHASRAVVAARPRAAGARLHRLGQDAVRHPRPARRADDAGADRADSRRDRRMRSRRARRRGRRHQQLAGGGRADAAGRSRRRRLSRAARIQGARRRAGRVDARARGPRPRRAGVRVSLAPHAPYSTSLELFGAIRDAVNEIARARS